MISTCGFSQWGFFFYVPHLLRHGTSVFKVISERPLILTSECRALGKGAITTYFKHLRFDAAGTSSRMLSESTTTRLRQLVSGCNSDVAEKYAIQTWPKIYFASNVNCIMATALIQTIYIKGAPSVIEKIYISKIKYIIYLFFLHFRSVELCVNCII
jgi:hypothetical protein